MRNTRSWDVAVVAAAVILLALALVNGDDGPELVGSIVVIAAVVLTWFLLGRGRNDGGRLAATAAVLLIVLPGIGTAISPGMATMQAIAFPVLWYLTPRTRDSIIANVGLATSVGIGYYLGLDATFSAFLQALVIETISLAGSLAIGLWITRISEESAARQALLDELTAARQELAVVNRDAGIVLERERLAREIHDTIAQDLTGLVLLAQRTKRELAGGSAAAGSTLDLLEESARAALAETRSLVAATAPVGLEADGILPALERLAARFERETGVTVGVTGEPMPPLERETEVVLLRCAQESLANVRKHAAARAASLTLAGAGNDVVLVATDDGVGFDRDAPGSGFGLVGMRDRLALVGGSLAISSAPGAGTTVTATLPRERNVDRVTA